MMRTAIVDALYSVPQRVSLVHITGCIPSVEDLISRMKVSGIAGAVLTHGNCAECHDEWSCADRKAHEIANLVARYPRQLRGLAGYDPLRIRESLRWIDETVGRGDLAGTYVKSERCVGGLQSPRMSPLYGVCMMLEAPVVIEFASQNRWNYQQRQVESVAAYYPSLRLLLAPPPDCDGTSMVQMMKMHPQIQFLLGPRELEASKTLCEYMESQGRDRVLFRSAGDTWTRAAQMALTLPLSAAAHRAYLSESALQVFGFGKEANAVSA